jgi:hypothetical protein
VTRLFNLGVVAMLGLGLDQGKRGVGEHRVVAPDVEQLALPAGGCAVEVLDPADDQPGGNGLAFLRGEGGVFHTLTLGSIRMVTEKNAPALRTAPVNAAE